MLGEQLSAGSPGGTCSLAPFPGVAEARSAPFLLLRTQPAVRHVASTTFLLHEGGNGFKLITPFLTQARSQPTIQAKALNCICYVKHKPLIH
jgi:hypothetical protein